MSHQLSTLLSHRGAPAFIHLHHPHHPPSALPSSSSLPRRCIVARLDAVEHHTPRLFLSGVLAKVSAAVPGAASGSGEKEVATLDGLARGLREVWARQAGKGKAKGKGRKGKEAIRGEEEEWEEEEGLVVVYVSKAERLRSVFGQGWAAITRLNELVGIPLTVVLASQVPWDELRPSRGDALEPVHIYLPPADRDDILATLSTASSHPLWPRFLDLLLSAAGGLVPASSPPGEIEYLATALWLIYTAHLPPHAEMVELGRAYPQGTEGGSEAEGTVPIPPPLEVTVKLLTDLKHQLSLALAAAIEDVLPRTNGRAELTAALAPEAVNSPSRRASSGTTMTGTPAASGSLAERLMARQTRTIPHPPALELPTAAKFIVVAAYCASYNPAKSDIRLFGRGTGPDGKRRRGGGTRRAGYGRIRMGKVPQRLLGPKPFPLDRMLAIFASLYAEHATRPPDLEPGYHEDDDEAANGGRALYQVSVAAAQARAERRRVRDLERDEKWDDEVDCLTMSVKLWGMIPELEGQGLLRRISPLDRLDNIMLRCELDYETAKTMAKELRFTLDEYLYESTE